MEFGLHNIHFLEELISSQIKGLYLWVFLAPTSIDAKGAMKNEAYFLTIINSCYIVVD